MKIFFNHSNFLVRVPVYYNCDGDRVTDACDACGTSCEKHNSTLAIALAVTFSIIAAVAIAALVLFFLWRKRQLKSTGEKKQPRNGPHAKANNGFTLPFKS